MSQRPAIPESTKRIVRRDAFFGCAICGNPLIEYCHIIPYSVSLDSSPENLVALCPNHHTIYDFGNISRSKIREHKANPINKNKDVKDRFDIEGVVPIIEAGSNIFENTPILMVIDCRNIVTLRREDDELLLNALLYDQNNNLLAFIKDNEWNVLSGIPWDIEYHIVAKALIVRTRPRNILLRLRIDKGVVHFSGLLSYNGFRVQVTRNRIVFGNNTISWQGCKFTDCISAIMYDTQTGHFEILSAVHEHERRVIWATVRNGWRYRPLFIGKKCVFCGQIEV